MMAFKSIADLKEVLQESGKQEFELKNYVGAIEQFSKILKHDPQDTKILANRSLAYLKFGLYHSALKDAQAALRIKPHCTKAIARKIQSLWGLNKYPEALQYFDSSQVPKNIRDLPYFKELHEKGVKFLKQSQGEYDMIEVSKLKPGECHDLAEFKGPIEIQEVPGKGRGLVATSDIQPGQLILVSKAFAIAFGFEDKEGTQMDKDKLDFLLQKCCEKLELEPELRQDFANLFSRHKAQNPGWIWKNAEDDEVAEQQMIKEVRDRIISNCFCGDGNPNYCGLWITPSYFNHNCIDANVHWVFYGDVMISRDVKEVKKGQELTINYFAPNDPDRLDLLKNHFKFTCDCRLCQFELNENNMTKTSIETTLESIKKDVNKVQRVGDKINLGTLVTRVKLLVSLRGQGNLTVNMALLDNSVENVALHLFGNYKFEEAASILQVIREVSCNAVFIESVVQKDMVIASCYIKLGLYPEVKKWIQILKKDLVIAYGTTDMMKEIGQSFLEDLAELDQGLDFFEL